MVHEYRFRNLWWLAASADRVFDALVDLEAYPLWWPHIREVSKVDDDTAELVCRSVLPFELVVRMTRAEQDQRAGRVRVNLSGDLEGWLGGVITRDARGTRLEIVQHVVAHKKLLRRLAFVARPVWLANHELMMRGGRRGLHRYLSSANSPDSPPDR
ncbi:MAG: polyketide cyclase [Sciscionella sp.]|nr:polyketide cyclase [Sciscionella sp.]